VALAMTIGVIVMVGSFEREVKRWIASILTADIYVSDANGELAREEARLPDAAVDRVRAFEGVRAVDTRRSLELPFRGRTILFNAFDWSEPERQIRARDFLEGGPDALERVGGGEALVSEPLSNRYDLHEGDTLAVRGPLGEASFRIAGVIRDYAHDRGYALTLAAPFVRAFGDPGVRNLGVHLEEGRDPEATARRLREALAGEFLLDIRSNRELRNEVIRVFERTFAVTYVLQVIATVMALSGIAVTLFGLFLERTREIATLRALGATVARVGRLFAVESLLLALFPILAAIPLGAVLAWVLIEVVNVRSFGWSFGYHWPWRPIVVTCALAAAAGLAATIVPILLTRRQSIAAALREE
jgi:putative ABC transport system permease protein